MPYASLIWAGRRRQRNTDPPHEVPVDACIGELGLAQRHYLGATPPFIKSPNPALDDYREAFGVAVHLTEAEVPDGWQAGWYVIPSTDLTVDAARRVLGQYPLTPRDPWIAPWQRPEKR